MRQFTFAFFLAALAYITPAAALAQADLSAITNMIGGGSVSGNGVAEIERLPEVMRLQIAILGKAATLKEALAGLNERVNAAKEQVATMGADKDSIKVGDPELSSTKSDRQNQIEQMIRAQMRSTGRNRKITETADPITVSATLTAQWPLAGKTAEELLLEIHELQKKIKAADLAGLEEASKLSPAEQEILEELEDSGYSSFGDDEENKPGEPTFFFVSAITQTEHDQATADAYKRAKAQAERLAKAAGATLGPLKSLASEVSKAENLSQYDPYRLFDLDPYVGSFTTTPPAGNNETPEAIGTKPGKVKYRVEVTASFTLKEQ